MTVAELKTKMKSADPGGAYVFCGEEDYLKKYYLKEFVNICCPDDTFSLFNQVVFDGAEVDIAEIAESLKSPPMMSDYKLIEWKYPDIEHMSESEKKLMCELADSISEYPYVIFILFTNIEGFGPGTQKRPSKLASRFAKSYNVVNFEKSTDAQLVGWLKRHFDADGIAASPDVLSALIFRSGHSMEVLNNEVKKLTAYAKANTLPAITKNDVDLVASATIECDAFALSTAEGYDKPQNRARRRPCNSCTQLRRAGYGVSASRRGNGCKGYRKSARVESIQDKDMHKLRKKMGYAEAFGRDVTPARA